jgi:hypothetical protein
MSSSSNVAVLMRVATSQTHRRPTERATRADACPLPCLSSSYSSPSKCICRLQPTSPVSSRLMRCSISVSRRSPLQPLFVFAIPTVRSSSSTQTWFSRSPSSRARAAPPADGQDQRSTRVIQMTSETLRMCLDAERRHNATR